MSLHAHALGVARANISAVSARFSCDHLASLNMASSRESWRRIRRLWRRKQMEESKVQTPRMQRRRMQRRTLLGLMNTQSVFPTHTITYNASGCWGLVRSCIWQDFFEKHFIWLLRIDSDCYGHTARLYVERCYIVYKNFQKLVEEGGWGDPDVIASYLEAIEHISELGRRQECIQWCAEMLLCAL